MKTFHFEGFTVLLSIVILAYIIYNPYTRLERPFNQWLMLVLFQYFALEKRNLRIVFNSLLLVIMIRIVLVIVRWRSREGFEPKTHTDKSHQNLVLYLSSLDRDTLENIFLAKSGKISKDFGRYIDVENDIYQALTEMGESMMRGRDDKDISKMVTKWSTKLVLDQK